MKPKHLQIRFPTGGLSKRYAYQDQPPYTTPSCSNVRPYALDGRERGGSRPPFKKGYALRLGSGNPVRMISDVRYVSSGTLTTRLMASANGLLYREEPAGALVAVANMSSLSLSTSLPFFAVDYAQKLYIGDWDTDATISANARKPKIYDPATDTLSAWTVDNYEAGHPDESDPKGALPTGCSIITLWHNRIVMSGARNDPQNWYMSRLDDPHDWDYSVDEETAAVAGNNSETGELGDVVSALIPHSNNCLLMGSPTSMWVMRGDPKAGGVIHNLSRRIGVVGPHAWCHAPVNADGSGGEVCVFLSDDGVYAIAAGCDSSLAPQSISRERIPNELKNQASGAVLVYDVLARGIHIFAGTHWFLDWTTKGFFPVTLGDSALNPTCSICARNATHTNQPVFGCTDGYVRYFNAAGTTLEDEGHASSHTYTSNATIGPLQVGEQGSIEGVLARCQAEIRSEGDDISVEFQAAWSAQDLVEGPQDETTETFGQGISPYLYPRLRGTDFGVEVSSTDPWKFERMTIELEPHGPRTYQG